MNWIEFKELVDKRLDDINVEGSEVEIEWIDIGDFDEFEVKVTQGSDDRLEMKIY